MLHVNHAFWDMATRFDRVAAPLITGVVEARLLSPIGVRFLTRSDASGGRALRKNHSETGTSYRASAGFTEGKVD